MVRRGGSKKLFPGGMIFNKRIENISEIGGGAWQERGREKLRVGGSDPQRNYEV